MLIHDKTKRREWKGPRFIPAKPSSLKVRAKESDLPGYNEKGEIEKENSEDVVTTGAIFGPPVGSFAFARFW